MNKKIIVFGLNILMIQTAACSSGMAGSIGLQNTVNADARMSSGMGDSTLNTPAAATPVAPTAPAAPTVTRGPQTEHAPPQFIAVPPAPSLFPETPPAAAPAPQPKVAPVPAPKPANRDEVLESGVITPTIYFTPVIDLDESSCDDSDKESMRDLQGNKLIELCSKDLDNCAMEGTCFTSDEGKYRRFNIVGMVNGHERYAEFTKEDCQFGYGVDNLCLDPFYTLAADLSIYRAGDIISIPSIKGTELPDGSVHTGYFIVGDKGRGINGRGRFDFFTGFLNSTSSKNPFSQLKLGDHKTHFSYTRISGPNADIARQKRNFPTK